MRDASPMEGLRQDPSYIDLVLWALDRFPDRVAIIEDDVSFTYRQLRDRISQLAGVLSERGIPARDGAHGAQR